MITMKYHELSNNEFKQAIVKLSRSPIPGFLAYKVAKLIKGLDKAREKIFFEYMKDVIEPNAEKDSNGNILHEDNGSPKILKENEGKMQEINNTFAERIIELTGQKIPLKELETIKFTAVEMIALEPIISSEQ